MTGLTKEINNNQYSVSTPTILNSSLDSRFDLFSEIQLLHNSQKQDWFTSDLSKATLSSETRKRKRSPDKKSNSLTHLELGLTPYEIYLKCDLNQMERRLIKTHGKQNI